MGDEIKFYMKIPLPDGSFTNGRVDYNRHPDDLGLSNIDLAGKRVLDIAANDGFWSFWAEEAGSKDVLAIDVDSFEGYDWGFDGCSLKQHKTGCSHWDNQAKGFWHLHNLFKSKVKKENLSVYDLSCEKHGCFDLIFEEI